VTIKKQSVKIELISIQYFPRASIQYLKESSNYNINLYFAGAVDTGEAPEESNISANIWQNSE
jgi:hypothetical protein